MNRHFAETMMASSALEIVTTRGLCALIHSGNKGGYARGTITNGEIHLLDAFSY